MSTFRVTCQECGTTFRTSKTLPECPKCGGGDVELADPIIRRACARTIAAALAAPVILTGCSLVGADQPPSAAVCHRVEVELFVADGYPVPAVAELLDGLSYRLLADACGCHLEQGADRIVCAGGVGR